MQQEISRSPIGPTLSRFSLALLHLAAVVVIIAGLKVAAPLVTQFLLIAFISIIVTPAYFQLVRWRLPSWLALSLLISALIVAILYGVTSLTKALTQLAQQLPDYHRDLLAEIRHLEGWFKQRNIELPPNLFAEIAQTNLRSWGGWLASSAGSLLGNAAIILLIVIFVLCEAATLPRRLRESSWMTPEIYQWLEHVVVDVRHYMGIKTVISMATGIAIYIGLLLLNIDAPLLLGLLAFLLNYVPTVGSIVAGFPSVLIALIQHGVQRAFIVLLLYLIVNQVIGSIWEPRIMGKGFGVSPVVILLSLLFWGWVLGPVGMLLSVPLTMGMRVVLGSLREAGPLSSLTATAGEVESERMAPAPPKAPPDAPPPPPPTPDDSPGKSP